MPTTTADQQLPLPAGADSADAPAFMTSFAGVAEDKLVKQYTNEADRTSRNGTPGQGEICWLQNLKRFEYWNDTAAAWWEVNPLIARKTAEAQTANNTTTFLSDTHLVLPMRASAVYKMRGFWYWDSGITGDIKWQWLGPAGFTVPAWTVSSVGTAVNNTVGNLDASGSNSATTAIGRTGAGIGTFVYGILEGIVVTVATAGNLQLQWTQSALEAVNTRMKTHSTLELLRIG